MDSVDRVAQWQQVSEHYRSLTDDELIGIARDREDLTEIAQQVLAAELQTRGLKIPAEEAKEVQAEPVLPNLEPDPDDPYQEDRELVEIERVYSQRDAQQLESLLNEDGIPFYIGREKATRVEDVKSNFSEGVPVGVMRIGLPFATRARRDFRPQDDPERAKEQTEIDEAIERPLEVFCPKCRSEQVLLDASRPDAAMTRTGTRYSWRCEACGKRWEDDGVMDEG